GQILGDMGADVIKVEPLNGEHFRPHFGGAWVPSMNRNKRGLALDLRTAGGREVLMRLVAKADVFIEAFTPGVIDKLGFGWDVVSKENPRLIYASVSGYGQTGRGQRLDLSLFDVGMHLMSHWITNHGLKGEDPIRMGTGNSFIFPLRVFPTKTQPIFIAGTNDA